MESFEPHLPKELPHPSLHRGIAPRILLSQIRNTAPFLFDGGRIGSANSPHLEKVRRWDRLFQGDQDPELTHLEYFELCLSAHHATVACFVPTDVDNQIRFKLWNPTLSTETLRQMAEKVVESAGWDFKPVSARWVASPRTGESISGHNGEWFSTAAAAYGALRRRDPSEAAEMAALILREIDREARILTDLERARDGIGILKAATLIAHNLGDLDRVIELWKLPGEDPLAVEAHKLGHEALNGREALSRAGALNKAHMAIENHRHFALRDARCLRKSADLLLPIGPFFDSWGEKVARHPALSPREIGEVVEALVAGWERQARDAKPGVGVPVGYARALAGILEAFPGGFAKLTGYLPARAARTLKAGTLRGLCAVPRRRFEEQWNKIALNFVSA